MSDHSGTPITVGKLLLANVSKTFMAGEVGRLTIEVEHLRAELEANREDDNMRILYTANVEADNEKLRADRDALAEALRKVIGWYGWHVENHGVAMDAVWLESAQQALSQYGGNNG